jgi:hypothetical protein
MANAPVSETKDNDDDATSSSDDELSTVFDPAQAMSIVGKAVGKVGKVLEPLDLQSRDRVLRAAAALMGYEITKR